MLGFLVVKLKYYSHYHELVYCYEMYASNNITDMFRLYRSHKQVLILLYFVAYQRILNNDNTMCAISGAETYYPSWLSELTSFLQL
jgi:hypothetical protein